MTHGKTEIVHLVLKFPKGPQWPEVGPSCVFPLWVAESHVIGLSSADFLGALQGAGTEAEQLGFELAF